MYLSNLVLGCAVSWSWHRISYWSVRAHCHMWLVVNPLIINISLESTEVTYGPQALDFVNLLLRKYLFSFVYDSSSFSCLACVSPEYQYRHPCICFLNMSFWVKYICVRFWTSSAPELFADYCFLNSPWKYNSIRTWVY